MPSLDREQVQHPKPWTKGQRRRLHTAEAHLEALERLERRNVGADLDASVQITKLELSEIKAELEAEKNHRQALGEQVVAANVSIDALIERITKLEAAV